MNGSSMMTSPCRADLPQPGPVRFASCYGYSPSGTSAAARRSRHYRSLLKSHDRAMIGNCARRVAREVAAGGTLASFFAVRPVLVPVPSSARTIIGVETPASILSASLLDTGLGCTVWPGLWRCHPVVRSSCAMPGCRPTVLDHYLSLCVARKVPEGGGFLLVDDLISKGRTLLAAAIRLRAAAPHARIEAFALMRTTSLVPDIDSLVDPCAGLIGWVRGDARRYP